MANKREFILDKAQQLFIEQGFDQTSIVQILKATGIARGTLYYYFSSKEEIMDAIIERSVEEAFAKAREAAKQKDGTILERFFATVLALNLNQYQGQELVAHLQAPQNALLHEKSNQILLATAPQILLPIVEEGIATGLMKTRYPYESLEMVLVYALQVFNQTFQELSAQEQGQKIQAFIYLMEQVFQTERGYFAAFAQLMS